MKTQPTARDVTDLIGAAARLSCHPTTVRRLCKAGRLPFFRLGSRIRIRVNDLDAFVAESCRATAGGSTSDASPSGALAAAGR